MNSTIRIFAIISVFVVACIGWQVLGGVTSHRTVTQSTKLDGEVNQLWGSPQVQKPPALTFHWKTQREVTRTEESDKKMKVLREMVIDDHEKEVSPDSTAISADIGLDQRLKGLMWYSLYGVVFDGTWSYTHAEPVSGTLELGFLFPDPSAMYDDFQFVVDGKDLAKTLRPDGGKVASEVLVSPGQRVSLRIHYRTRGMDQWVFSPAASSVASLRDFRLRLTTDFADIDFPGSAMSPSRRERAGDGWRLDWSFKQVLTGHSMGVVMPTRIQPGELASDLAHSAPISLLLFFVLIFVLSVLRRLDIHPVNYLAMAAAFFSFHLLFAYSVDHWRLVPAFVVASLVSIVLVVSYLRLVVSPRFAYREAAAAQLVYQVGFSLAHFWGGYTGLTVSVLCIVTLFVLMQLTGRIRWSAVLSSSPLARAVVTATPASTAPINP